METKQELPPNLSPLQNLHVQNHVQSFTGDLVEDIEKITGYKFKNSSILQEAFTDNSCKLENGGSSYDRLEYVGDSVLNLLIAKEQYLLYPDLAPGDLTRLRAANVDTEKLARVAINFNLHKYLRHNKPLLNRQIEEFTDAISEYPLHSAGLVDAPKALADIVESLIGAIYIDCNFSMDTTWQIVKNLLQPLITPATLQIHPVTRLYEICQKNGLALHFVYLWEETGEIEVYVANEFAGKGKYNSKKLIALNRAAHDAYNQIVTRLHGGQKFL